MIDRTVSSLLIVNVLRVFVYVAMAQSKHDAFQNLCTSKECDAKKKVNNQKKCSSSCVRSFFFCIQCRSTLSYQLSCVKVLPCSHPVRCEAKQTNQSTIGSSRLTFLFVLYVRVIVWRCARRAILLAVSALSARRRRIAPKRRRFLSDLLCRAAHSSAGSEIGLRSYISFRVYSQESRRRLAK